jgi:hypothetical protein
MPPTMEQLEIIYFLLCEITSPMLNSMMKPYRSGVILEFWMEDARRADMLIDLFKVDAGSR